MSAILSFSSEVVYGAIGNSICCPIWQQMGFDAWSIPTVLLSNHPGLGPARGHTFTLQEMDELLGGMRDNGYLKEVAAVFSGYLGDADQANLITETVDRLKRDNPKLIYCCDPVIGDEEEGLYVKERIAHVIKETLLPRADILTPNLFELSWLTDQEISTEDEAIEAARALHIPTVLITSAPAKKGSIANLLVTKEVITRHETKQLAEAPKGTGDAIAANLLGQVLGNGADLNSLIEKTNHWIATNTSY